MRNSTGSVTAAALAVVALLSGADDARAQSYPDRPIRILVSIAAGSVTDVVMRAAAQELSPRLGQPVVVENRPGASGIIGAQACTKAPPDGYTLCTVYHNTMSLNPFLFDKLPYDPDKDFEPITGLFHVTELLAASTALPVNSVAEVRSLVAKKPDALNWGTLGAGSYPELFLKWVNNQWNAKIVAVPYTGGGPIAQAMAGNQIQLGSMGVGNFLGVLQAGKVKPLAVSSARRSPLMPNVPTFAEAGIGGYPGRAWWGLAAPAGTPRPVLERINRELDKLFKEERFAALLEKNAVVGFTSSIESFKDFLKKDRAGAQELIKIANQPRTEYKQ